MAWDKKYRKKLSEYSLALHQKNELGLEQKEKQNDAGKLTVKERMVQLFDDDIFHEIDVYIESVARDFGMDKKRRPGDGVITGWGMIEGKVVYAASQDVSVLGGSLG